MPESQSSGHKTEGHRTRLAVVLFNLGGPDGPDDVRPFLRNLFSDPAIIGLPAPLRLPLARYIAARREAEAKANYAVTGGGSPLLAETQAQADALQTILADRLQTQDVRVFIAMRYWRPLTEETARVVAGWPADEVVLLPLYPQLSTTTTVSSLAAWRRAYHGHAPVRTVCCYPDHPGLIEAHARRIEAAFEAAGRPANLRLLFSAHGIPERLVARGDPYQHQVERTVAAVMARLGAGWDGQLCYQSRVGPLRWLGPSTPEALEQAAAEGRNVMVSPIAFVSEHAETLVELDHEYADLARRLGIDTYIRAPALGVEPAFIDALADMTQDALARPAPAISAEGAITCPAAFSACPRAKAA